MSEIQTLTDEIQRLNQSVDSWNNWRLVWMAVTAIVTVFLVIAQSKSITTAKSLSSAQAKLLQSKEEKLAKELREKDELIEKAHERAALADRAASDARLALAKYREPRIFPPEKRGKYIERLKRFSGTAYDVATLTPDSVEFAIHLSELLKGAGWQWKDWTGEGTKVYMPAVERWAGFIMLFEVDIRGYNPDLAEAVKTLVEIFNDAGFVGTRGDIRAPAVVSETNTIHIMIGPKR